MRPSSGDVDDIAWLKDRSAVDDVIACRAESPPGCLVQLVIACRAESPPGCLVQLGFRITVQQPSVGQLFPAGSELLYYLCLLQSCCRACCSCMQRGRVWTDIVVPDAMHDLAITYEGFQPLLATMLHH